MNIFHRIALPAILAFTSAQASADTTLESARQSLKDYGLARCLLAAWPDDSPARDDVAAASRALHYMGQGKHRIVQDEDTLEVTHDPYQIIDGFVREAYAEHAAQMKDGSESGLLGCLAVYRLEEFERVVVEQDGFVGE